MPHRLPDEGSTAETGVDKSSSLQLFPLHSSHGLLQGALPKESNQKVGTPEASL